MFTVMILEAVPDHLKGYLERFLYEIKTGVFVGNLSRKVIDQIRDAVLQNLKTGEAVILTAAKNEAGFIVEHTDSSRRVMLDFDGWQLPCFKSLEKDSSEREKE